jgi:RNA polymerase sigma factor (TIGR02999 family)
MGAASNSSAVRRLFELVYEELRGLAADVMRAERPDHTLQPTALVHEAYCRLVDGSETSWQNRAHFFGIAARAMREILVEHARKRAAAKRGGDWQRVTFHDELPLAARSDIEVLELNEALTRLAELDERMVRIVELRVFVGMTAGEAAHALGLSRRTVQNEWRVATMWLRRELEQAGDHGS